jgi:hypothetical protein
VHLGDAALGGERLGACPVAGGDGRDLVAQRSRRGDDTFVGDPGGAEDADAQRRQVSTPGRR